MAKNIQSFNQIVPLNFRSFSFCIALVCLPQIHRVSGLRCGTAFLSADIPTNRIFKVNVYGPTNWPFSAALYFNNGSQYMCGGTIISVRHILTAAHCIQGKGAEKQREKWDIEVRLGAYNLTVKDEESVVLRNVTEIYVHPDWNASRDDYDADLAVLELTDNIVFTNYIQPICLPKSDTVVDGSFIDVKGQIVGWGLDRNKTHEEIPKEINIQALNDSYCYRNDIGIVSLSSDRTFCGIGVGSPNGGDTGGGFFVDIDLVWRQYGIISSIRVNEAGKVVSNLASVYTNVKSFRDWIVETVAKSGLVVGGLTLNCKYSVLQRIDRIKCELFDLDIRRENIEVDSFTGSYIYGGSEVLVTRIDFVNGTMTSLPNEIGHLFRNLQHFEVGGYNPTLGTQRIRRLELQKMEKLKRLHFRKNNIETLDEDALWDLPKLEKFSLVDNKLKQLHGKTFEKNIKIDSINLFHNQLEFLPRNLFRYNELLKSIDFSWNAIKIIEIDFTALNLRQINLGHNVCIPKSLEGRSPIKMNEIIRTNCSRSDV